MFLISQMFFIQFWRLPAHFWMVQVIFRLSFSLNVPFPAQYPFVLYFYPTWSHVIMQLTAITYQFLFKATLPNLQMKEHPVVTPLLLHNNQEFFFKNYLKLASYTTYKTFSNDKSLTIPLSLMYKSHPEIPPNYSRMSYPSVQIQGWYYFDEFWIHSTAKSQDTRPGLNFFLNSLHGQTLVCWAVSRLVKSLASRTQGADAEQCPWPTLLPADRTMAQEQTSNPQRMGRRITTNSC